MDCINLALDMGKWQAVLNVIVNQVLQNAGLS
jgi:hypothetical protein